MRIRVSGTAITLIALFVGLLPGIAAAGEGGSDSSSIGLYRFYNTSSGVHFYTGDSRECIATTHYPEFSKETSLGVALAADTPTDDLTARLYRFYDPATGDRLYTTSEYESNLVKHQAQYRFEGVTAVVYTAEGEGLLPIYRYYNYVEGKHFLTASLSEGSGLDRNFYRFEGVAFYVEPLRPPPQDVVNPTSAAAVALCSVSG